MILGEQQVTESTSKLGKSKLGESKLGESKQWSDPMYASILITLALSSTQPYPEEFETTVYTEETEITYDDLVVDVHGYKVPTRSAFRGWMLLNHAEDKVKGRLGNRLKDAGVTTKYAIAFSATSRNRLGNE